MIDDTASVRLARGGDAKEIVDLRNAAARWQMSRGIVQWAPGEIGVDVVRAQCQAGEWWVLVRESDGVRGAVRVIDFDPAVWSDEEAAGYVHGLMIDRREVGRGLGAELLMHAEELIHERGASRVRLDCVESNAQLRAWYRSHGYTEVGRIDFGLHSPWHPVMRFEKVLTA